MERFWLRLFRRRAVRWGALSALALAGAYFAVRPWYDPMTGETARDRGLRAFVDLQDRVIERRRIDDAARAVEAAAEAAVRSYSATMKKYLAVKDGMYPWDVDEIVGRPGVEVLSSGSTAVYRWPGEDPGSGMTATFESLKLVAKAQVGLR